VLLFATLIVALLNVLIRPEAPAPSSWGTVSVAPSGTLWEIAASHPVRDLSTQQVVRLIQQENGLTSGTVYAGQVLRVPSQEPALGVAVALR
jgi:Tfp pilus assembly protein FimV